MGMAVSVAVTGLVCGRLSLKFAYFFLEPMSFLEPLGCAVPEGSIVTIVTATVKLCWLTRTGALPAHQELCPGDFPGGAVVKTPSSQCRGPRFRELDPTCRN